MATPLSGVEATLATPEPASAYSRGGGGGGGDYSRKYGMYILLYC